MFDITVAPVVVQPDVDSKTASTKLNFRLSSMRNGIAPKKLKTNQNIATIKNPSRILICDLSFLFGKYARRPTKKIIKKD